MGGVARQYVIVMFNRPPKHSVLGHDKNEGINHISGESSSKRCEDLTLINSILFLCLNAFFQN